jgi:hypothetical protein
MAVLTDSQKDLLLVDASFQSEVKWAILNKAAFQLGLNGVGLADAASATQWRKYTNLSLSLNSNPSIAESIENVKKFLIYLKGVDCVQGAFSASSVVAFLLNNGAGYNNFDAASSKWFDDTITTSL